MNAPRGSLRVLARAVLLAMLAALGACSDPGASLLTPADAAAPTDSAAPDAPADVPVMTDGGAG